MIRSQPTAIHRCKDIPSEPHYAALVERSFNENDGYGGTGSVTLLDYVAIGNEEQLKAWVLEQDTPKYGAPTVYKILRMTPVTIHKHVEISLTPT